MDGILSSESESEGEEAGTPSLPAPNSQPFFDEAPNVDPLGDRFGDYVEQDFEMGFMDSASSRPDSPGHWSVLVDEDNKIYDDDDDEELENAAVSAAAEREIELERPSAPRNADTAEWLHPSDLDPKSTFATPAPQATETVMPALYPHPYVVQYANHAGEPSDTMMECTSQDLYRKALGDTSNPYAPFETQLEWEIARWAKLRGPSSTAFTELMAIEGVADKLGLSFKNTRELNKIIDQKLPGRSAFKCVQVEVGGEIFDVYMRDIMSCIKALYSDPDFAPYMKFSPERHYEDEACTVRMYHDMQTGEWWWSTQEQLDRDTKPGATIIPILLSSDKTQLTLFRNKSAYPLYMTIGNIPKEIRRRPSCRAYVLLAYLPTSKLEHIPVAASRRRCLLNLYHSCMSKIVSPIIKPGQTGMAMATADGVTRRVHPLYASFIGDYPEQVQVACTTYMDCAVCPTYHNQLGDPDAATAQSWRPLHAILDALHAIDVDPLEYRRICMDNRLKPVIEPFWKDLPYTHVYRSITPDVLHQLYQGVIKHLVSWIESACGPAEIDARCRRLPPNHNIRIFFKGITSLSRVTGKEHAQICQFLLALVLDIPLENGISNKPLIRAIRALLDFLYLAQYPVHTATTLSHLDNALAQFHDNKHVFMTLGIRENFNIPKLHFALHYVRSIKLFGTTDNFNTEYTERLHIDLAKDAYNATNHKDEFAQMAIWLERKEKVTRHHTYIHWRLAGCIMPPKLNWSPPGLDDRRFLKMTKHPSIRSAVSIDNIECKYGATHFLSTIARFIALQNNPQLTRHQLEDTAEYIDLPCRRLLVWHSIKYLREDPITQHHTTADIIHARPAKKTTNGQPIPARFDTVLVNVGHGQEKGVTGRRAARVRVIFSLPDSVSKAVFNPDVIAPCHLAYVEWYTPFRPIVDPIHGLHSISTCHLDDGTVLASIIPVTQIFRSVHLFPKFGPSVPSSWTSSNVLDNCHTFFVNPFTDRHLYIELQK